MTLRVAYNLFTQKPKQEKEDFARWIKMTGPGRAHDFFRCNLCQFAILRYCFFKCFKRQWKHPRHSLVTRLGGIGERSNSRNPKLSPTASSGSAWNDQTGINKKKMKNAGEGASSDELKKKNWAGPKIHRAV